MLNLYYVHVNAEDFDLSRVVTATSHVQAKELWHAELLESECHNPDMYDVWVELLPSVAAEPGVH